MAAFVSKQQSISAASATKIVDAADFDRRVVLSGTVHFAFTSGDAPTGITTNETQPSNAAIAVFALPADEELWVYSSGATSISVLVTTTA